MKNNNLVFCGQLIKLLESTRSELYKLKENSHIWRILAHQDIKVRYRRSALGPWWFTLSTLITIFTMGYLYSHLFRAHRHIYIPYLAAALIGWGFISSLMQDSCTSYIQSSSYIRSHENALSVFNMRTIVRNIIILLHNMVAFLPVMLYYHLSIGWNALFLIPGILIISLNALFWGSVISTIATRFRDYIQIQNSLMRIAFFLTPIIWMPTRISAAHRWVLDYNPFYQFLMLVRNPILNEPLSVHTISMTLLITGVGFLVYAINMNKFRHQVVFWL